MNPHEVEISFCEGLLRRDPDYVEVLQILGDLYTKVGQADRALATDMRLTQLRPEDPVAFYNLACCYAVMGRVQDAFDTLTRTVALGYADAHWMERDPDLQNLHTDSRFGALVEQIRRKHPQTGA